MQKSSHTIFEPLSPEETATLQAFSGDPKAGTTTAPGVLDALLERGYLLKVKANLLVTPEGLAALLDCPR